MKATVNNFPETMGNHLKQSFTVVELLAVTVNKFSLRVIHSAFRSSKKDWYQIRLEWNYGAEMGEGCNGLENHIGRL